MKIEKFESLKGDVMVDLNTDHTDTGWPINFETTLIFNFFFFIWKARQVW